MTDREKVELLETEVRSLNRVLAGQRHWLKVAAKYENEDLGKRLDAIQAALLRAAEYEPRVQRKRGRSG